MSLLSLKKITGSEGLDLGGRNAPLAGLAAGFALGPAGFGLMSAGQAGLAAGAAMSLSTGSLEKGLMAGLSAYGGAGLSAGLMNLGSTSPEMLQAANASADPIASLAQAKEGTAPLTGFDALKAGAQNATNDPKSFMNAMGGGTGLAKYGLAATLPILAGSGVQTTTGLPSASQGPGYVRPFDYDIRTGRLTPYAPVSTSRLYAEGGAVKPSDDGYVHAELGGFLSGIGNIVQEGMAGNQTPEQSQQPTQPDFRNAAAQAAIQQQLINESQARFAQNQAAQQAAQQAVTTPFQAAPTTPAQAALTQAIASAPVAPAPTLTPMTGDSAAAYNYLMGQSPYPYVTQDKEVFRPYTDILAQRATGTTPLKPTPTPVAPATPAANTGGGGGGGVGLGDLAALGALGGGAYAAGLFGGGGNYAPVEDMSTYSPAAAAESDAIGTAGGAAAAGNYAPVEDLSSYTPAAALESDAIGGATIDEAATMAANAGMDWAGLAAEMGPYAAAAYVVDRLTGGAVGNAISDVGDFAGDVVSGIGNAAQNFVSSIFGGWGWADGGQVNGLSAARYNLGGYSDGGRLLRGPGDGVSDSIPATIGDKQPARLADGEFVVPARIVSELGNGSTEAGARKLYAMMDRVQSARSKTVGKGKVARNTRADKYLPA